MGIIEFKLYFDIYSEEYDDQSTSIRSDSVWALNRW